MVQQLSSIIGLFKKNPVGLDISDRTIEIVELAEEGKEVKIISMSRALLPKGVVDKGRIKDTQKLAAALDQAMKSAHPEAITPKKIIFGIPEAQIYTHVFELGPHKREDRDRLVEEEMEASIPLQKDEALFAYSTIYESPRLTGIVLIATRKEIFSEWQNFFKNIGFGVDMYESETLAIARGLFNSPLQSPACIVDIGSATTTISIFSKHGLQYLQSLPDAGDAITLSLSKELNILPKDAERMKIKTGLSNQKDKNFFIITKILQTIGTRVKTSINYFHDKTGESIERVVLVGGSAKLKGIKEYFEENLGTPVWLGESVFLRSQAFLEYVEASGLALRGLNPKKFVHDPGFVGHINTAPANAPVDEQSDEKDEKNIARQMVSQEQNSEPIIIAPIQFVRTPATRGQQLMLLGVLIAGIGGVVWAGMIRDRGENGSNATSPPIRVLRETAIQIFTETIPLMVSPDADAPDGAVNGEFFELEVANAASYVDAIARARTDASAFAAKQSKELWQAPVNQPDDIDKVTFPLRIKWLLYSASEVTDVLLQKIRQKTDVDISALSPHVTVLNISSTANPNVFTLAGRVRISTPEFITIKRPDAGENNNQEAGEKLPVRVMILDTPIGWLNARKGPGTSYPLVIRTYPGEKYLLLEEQGEWYKIQLGREGGTEAWIHAQYARKE